MRWYSIESKSPELAEVVIYDEIGLYGVTAQNFLADLAAVGERRILLRLNSPGGDVFEGLAIYNRLREHKAGVEVRIDSLAASMAAVIAMVGSPVKIAGNAMLMIHNPNGLVAGSAADMRDVADVLDKVRENLLGAFERKTGLGSARLSALLDAETWMTADQAKLLGFVDEITEPLQIAARVEHGKFRNAPARFKTGEPTEFRGSILAALGVSEAMENRLSDEQIAASVTSLREREQIALAAAQKSEAGAVEARAGKEKAEKKLGLLEGLAGVRGLSLDDAPPQVEPPPGLRDSRDPRARAESTTMPSGTVITSWNQHE